MKKDTNQPTKTKKKKGARRAGFRRFWAAYPLREGRGDAHREWKKLFPTNRPENQEEVRRILERLAHYKRTQFWMKDDGEFIPWAVTFLKQRAWRDGGQTRPSSRRPRRFPRIDTVTTKRGSHQFIVKRVVRVNINTTTI